MINYGIQIMVITIFFYLCFIKIYLSYLLLTKTKIKKYWSKEIF